MKLLKLTFSLLLILEIANAQDNIISRNSFLKAGLNQINEDENFGLVFKGPGINYGMAWNIENDRRLIIYEFELGAGILFSREIPALGFYLKPFDISWLFKIPLAGKSLYMGPVSTMEYNYNLYPDLQAGFDYWFTNISLGLGAIYDFDIRSSSLRVKLNTTIAGFHSRQEPDRGPYYYDLGFKYAIKHLNQTLSFGSYDDFNVTNFELQFKVNKESRYIIGYYLKYSGFYDDPGLTILNQGIKLIIGKKQK